MILSLGAEREITVDPIVVNGREYQNEIIVAKTPPRALPSWWPWAVGAVVVVGLYLLTREEGDDRPLADE